MSESVNRANDAGQTGLTLVSRVQSGYDYYSLREAGVVPSSARPFAVKITGYRLLNILIVLALGTVKLGMTLRGYSLVPTALDWITGVLFAIA